MNKQTHARLWYIPGPPIQPNAVVLHVKIFYDAATDYRIRLGNEGCY